MLFGIVILSYCFLLSMLQFCCVWYHHSSIIKYYYFTVFGLLSILCFACKVIFLFLGLLCVVLFLLLLSFLLVLPAFIVISYLQLFVLLILYFCCVEYFCVFKCGYGNYLFFVNNTQVVV